MKTAAVMNIDLVSVIRDEHNAAQRDHLSAVQHAIRCGELLIEAKAGVSHGEWHTWIATNVPFAHRTAQGYMRLARLDPTKAQRVADMSLRQALKDVGEEFGRKQRRLERQVDRDLVAHRELEEPVVHDGVAVRVDDAVHGHHLLPEIEANLDESASPKSRITTFVVDLKAPARKATDVEKIIDRATTAIATWFSSVAGDDERAHLARAIREVVAEWVAK